MRGEVAFVAVRGDRGAAVLARHPDGEAPTATLTDDDLARWAALRTQLLAVWFDAEVTQSAWQVTVDDAYFALTLTITHDATTLSVPPLAMAPTSPPSVNRLVGAIIDAVERETGTVAVDAATGAPWRPGDPGGLSASPPARASKGGPGDSVALSMLLIRVVMSWGLVLVVLVVLAPSFGISGAAAAVAVSVVFAWIVFVVAVAVTRVHRQRRKQR